MAKRRKYKKARLKKTATLKSSRQSRELSLIIYWTTMLVLIMINFFAAIVVIPFLFLVPTLNFYLILSMIALFFGYVFSMLVTRIDNVDLHHHVFAALFIPAFALVNLIMLSSATISAAQFMGIPSEKNPTLVSLFYAAFFTIPHATHVMKNALQKIIKHHHAKPPLQSTTTLNSVT